MSANGTEDGTTVDVEYLYETSLVSCDTELAVCTNLARGRDVLEARDGLDYSVGLGRVDLEASARGDYVTMGRRRRELDVGYGRVRLDEEGRLVGAERAEVSGRDSATERCESCTLYDFQ